MNQHGFATEGSGFVNLRIQVVTQHPGPPVPVVRGKHALVEEVIEAPPDRQEEEDAEMEMRHMLVARAEKRLAEAEKEKALREERLAKKGNLTAALARTSSSIAREKASPASLLARTASALGSPGSNK